MKFISLNKILVEILLFVIRFCKQLEKSIIFNDTISKNIIYKNVDYLVSTKLGTIY